MIALRRWIDLNLWSIPVFIFLILELTLSVSSATSRTPVLLTAARPTARQQVYASLTSSSSALLGLALAAVAILAAFGPRPVDVGAQARHEPLLARARANLIGALLAASFFLLVVLITATVALAVDTRARGNSAIAALIESAGTASVAGLIISGLGLALVVVERSRP